VIHPSVKQEERFLGDRIRMNAINNLRCICAHWQPVNLIWLCQNMLLMRFRLSRQNTILLSLKLQGIGQSDTEIMDHSDVSLYVMTPEFGAATQLRKIDMLDFADLVALNKFDKRGL
jgi:methylmalonyl-CoA mutase